MRDKLYEKLENEIRKFKLYLKEKGVDYAIENAYELVVRQEILDCIEYDISLSNTQIRALLSKDNILDGLYDDWLSYDGNMRGNINYSVKESLDVITGDYKIKCKKNKNYDR